MSDKLVRIPIKWSTALLTSALTVTCGAADADVSDTDATGKTDACSWATYEIVAIEVEGVAHQSLAPLTACILVTSLTVDGGADLVPESYPIPVVPISSVEGKFAGKVEGLRKGQSLRLSPNQRATLGLALKGWSTALGVLSTQLSASLLCRVVNDNG